jgi:UDP-N-acetylmuramate: L-alanyl-gamma-D-glutamyl-meso-diaminopimelate ligase
MRESQEEPLSTDLPLLKPRAHVHLMGICGTGMAALAGLLMESGYRVTGSDQAVYPPMSDLLAELGADIMEGYRASNLDARPDLVIVGNVIRRVNPEAIALDNSGIPFCSMPAAVRTYFGADKTRIVVAGTHGKTTVTCMIAWILFQAGLDPGFLIGGIPNNFNRSYRLGGGRFFVIEGDEYDTAYFDKSPKFLHYDPDIAVITSCEFDHADIYSNVEQIQEQFEALSSAVPSTGCIVAYGDDARVQQLIRRAKAPVRTYSLNSGMEWTSRHTDDHPEGISASFLRNGSEVASGILPVVGLHNLINATAAIAATEWAGVDPQRAVSALGAFAGVKRRQEVLGQVGGIIVMDDFAHHPSAVKVTCEGVQKRFPNRRLVAVFEPRTNTSRRAIFQEQYVAALLGVGLAALREPRGVDELPELDRFSSRRLAADLQAQGTKALAFDDTDEMLKYLARELQPEDVVLIMSNGSFDGIGPRLLQALKER